MKNILKPLISTTLAQNHSRLAKVLRLFSKSSSFDNIDKCESRIPRFINVQSKLNNLMIEPKAGGRISSPTKCSKKWAKKAYQQHRSNIGVGVRLHRFEHQETLHWYTRPQGEKKQIVCQELAPHRVRSWPKSIGNKHETGVLMQGFDVGLAIHNLVQKMSENSAYILLIRFPVSLSKAATPISMDTPLPSSTAAT